MKNNYCDEPGKIWTTAKWDDKFGVLTVEGVGKEAPIETNSLGGKQSSSQYATHLLDPDFLDAMVDEEGPLHHIADYMREPRIATPLFLALEERSEDEANLDRVDLHIKRLLTIAKVLKEGAEKYSTNNWRLIPSEAHLNHAIIHYLAYLSGDKQDDHLAHFYTRLMMCYATKQSVGFSYTNYLPPTSHCVTEDNIPLTSHTP